MNQMNKVMQKFKCIEIELKFPMGYCHSYVFQSLFCHGKCSEMQYPPFCLPTE